MIINEKMIRELQRRVDISYEDAEKALRRAGGNIDIAEAYARKKANSFGSRFFHELEKIINATLIYRVNIYKKEEQFINVPILALILMVLIIGVNKALLLAVVSIVVALVADCDLEINKVLSQEEFSFYKTVNKEKMSHKNKSKEPMDTSFQEKSVDNTKDNLKSNNLSDPLAKEDLIQNVHEQASVKDKAHHILDKASDDDEYFEVTIDK